MVDLISRLQAIPEYQNAAKSIFNRDFDAFVLTRSISAFERTLISSNSRFDQYYYYNKSSALNNEEKEGWKIFSDKLYCTKCHPAPYFTIFTAENNGLYVDYGIDQGRFRIHGDSNDIGKFKVPTLRNIELTFPYMHDGSISTIEEVIQHYAKGGKSNDNQSALIKPFKLTEREIRQLKSFLFSLTDTSYMSKFKTFN
jgi:cytochrome c peroxidase